MLIDIIFLGLIIIACVKGYTKGMVVALFSFVALFIGLAAALKLSVAVAHYFQDTDHVSAKWKVFISFIIVFVIVIFLVKRLAAFVQKLLEKILLGWANRLAGMIIYALLYTIILSIFLFYINKIHLLPDNTIRKSIVYPYIKNWGPSAINGFAHLIPFFKNMFGQLENFFNGFSQKISYVENGNLLNRLTFI